MLCTSGFVDDVIFSHKGANGADSIRRPYDWSNSPRGGTSRRPRRARGRSVLSTIALLLLHLLVFLILFDVG